MKQEGKVYELGEVDVGSSDFERRREARIRFEAPARVESTALGKISDLSEEGAFVEMADPPKPGTIMELEFRLPGTRSRTRTLALVRWTRPATEEGPPSGCGVQFVWAPAGAQDEIRRTLSREMGSRLLRR